MRMKQNFMVLPDIKDVLEVLSIENPLLITSPLLTEERLDLEQLSKRTKSGERVAIMVSGSNSSFSRKEMDLGACRSLNARVDIGPSGTVAIILYALLMKKE
jgi:SpoU rRNA methylase family enzyme